MKDIENRGKVTEVHLAWYYRPEEAMGGRKVRPSACTCIMTSFAHCASVH